MAGKKAECYNSNKTLYCLLYKDNTITLGEDLPHEGGDLISYDQVLLGNHSVEDYLKEIDYYMQYYKKEQPSYYNKIIKMLKKEGFEYEPWKVFIKASADYLAQDKKKEEILPYVHKIEEILGYEVNVIKKEN